MSTLGLIRKHAKVAVFFLNVAALALFWPFGPKPFSRGPRDCASNLKQYSTAMQAYLADHDDGYPDRDHWMTALEKYSIRPESLYCSAVADIPGAFGYAMNSDIALRKKGSLRDSRTPLIYDSINSGLNASDPLTSLPTPARHGDSNFVLSVEGTVSRIGGQLPGARP